MSSSERQSYPSPIQSEKLSAMPNTHSDHPSHPDSESHPNSRHRSEPSRHSEAFSADGHPPEYYDTRRVRIKHHGGFFKNLFSNPLFCYIFGLVLTGILVALFILFLRLGNQDNV